MKFNIKFNRTMPYYKKLNATKSKTAFSLLEMTLVIVIGGILVGIMMQIYSALHANYLQILATNRLESATTNTMLIIQNYLKQSIKESIATRTNNQIQPLTNANPNATEFIWFSQSLETRQNNSSSYKWSGFIDISNIQITNNTITLHSPLSKFNTSQKDKVLSNLKLNDIKIIFQGSDEIYLSAHKIINATDELITIERPNHPVFVSEIYYLTHALISLKLQNGTLYLSEFSPSDLHRAVRSNPLAHNVSSFNIKQSGANIIFKLCLKDKNSVELCKSSSL